ncbi:MAG: asparagine synthetase [Candidatus Thiodiazotropha sp. (ex Epidulcina cf. delphinae)]|nr:asparagine synthetase [Candidatus Thiodiazotropha sp. (ex Epidulcina cf. delphinae)]
MLRILLILLPMSGMLTACQTLGEHQRAESLQDILRRYEAAIRWSSGRQARNFLPLELAKTEITPPVQRDVKVTHYEVVQGPTMLGDMRAVQTAVIQYVFQDSQIVREIMDQQEWRYDEEAEIWHLYSQVPVFR